MKKIEFEVTEGMREAGSLADISDSGAEQFIAMTAHPSFRKQLRAYVAGEVRAKIAPFLDELPSAERGEVITFEGALRYVVQPEAYDGLIAALATLENPNE